MEQQYSPTWGNWVSVWLNALKNDDTYTLIELAWAPLEKWPHGVSPASGAGSRLVDDMQDYRHEHREHTHIGERRTYNDWSLTHLPWSKGTGGICYPCGELVLRDYLYEPSCVPHRVDAKTGEDVFRGAYCTSCHGIAERVAFQDRVRSEAASKKKNPRGDKDKTTQHGLRHEMERIDAKLRASITVQIPSPFPEDPPGRFIGVWAMPPDTADTGDDTK